MGKYQHLLVAIDASQDDQPALRRAAYMVKKNGGRIKAFHTIFDPSCQKATLLSSKNSEQLKQSLIEKAACWLESQCHAYIEQGIEIEVKIAWHPREHEAIIEEVMSHKHDVLLKMAHQNDRKKTLLYTPLDWQLLRRCPCPVWLVKDQPWPEKGHALVSLNLSPDETDAHYHLNQRLIRTAQQIAGVIDDVDLHLVSAYPRAPINNEVDMPGFDPRAYSTDIRGRYLLVMKSLRQEFGIAQANTHVIKGRNEAVISQLVNDIGAGIVVLGTHGRTGLSGLIIGNTAESLIEHLTCDLLAIKPENFNCPMSLKESCDEHCQKSCCGENNE